ncbi:MAG: anion transporter [Candidatus Aenigmarchaeota archaeon]|nr:anion transporter [Candidatus Aenigmarchaeota archaeon]
MISYIPIIILAAVFILIAVRRVGKFSLRIWQIMLIGALAVLITLQISPIDALKAINIDVMLFLFSMFVIGRALEESGYLSHLAYKIFKRTKNVDQIVLIILFTIGLASGFLLNDTLAIIGTPVVLMLSKQNKISPKLMLLSLAFAVTIGSVVSPIGNPQNLIVALNIQNPFITFFKYLLLPTLINLFITYLILKVFYKKEFDNKQIVHKEEPIKDKHLALLSKITLIVIAVLVISKIVIIFSGLQLDFRLTYIALIAMLPILLLSKKRFDIIKNIDWSTLIFFISMFILMAAVWQSGFFQSLISGDITSITMILIVSVLLSQVISNVPLVILYTPILITAGSGTKELIALAAGSTIAGNLMILGAASNVIIIQNAEKQGETITFWEFAKIGIPLTILNILVYWIFLTFI